MPKPIIVWRNPKTINHTPRKRTLDEESDHDVYILQEFVQDGCLGFWIRICDFEVLAGGRCAA
jgi:hypothetical protein